LVGDAVRAQKPLLLEYPTSNVSQDIQALVGRLFSESERPEGLVKGFVDRLRRWFA
jgi:MinD-like ATPase involved in chromosome partitioning or flagellar assembly